MMPLKNLKGKIKAIIFDCDGVMFDSRNANIAFYNTILNHFHKPRLTQDALDVVHMSTAEESINYLFRDDRRLSEAQRYRTEVDYQQFIPLMTMEPFLEEVLQGLKKNHRLALCTNRTNTIHPILKTFRLKQYFDLVVSSLDVENPKPQPEGILKILRYFDISRQEAFYVGDSSVDQETSGRAKIVFVAYKNPKLQADYHINNLRALLSLSR